MKCFLSLVMLACLSLLFIPSLASADLLRVDIDLTGYAGRDITLSFGLWDYNFLDDSSVKIDNVALTGVLDHDFEGITSQAELVSDGWYSGLDIFWAPNAFLDPTVTPTGHAMQMNDDSSVPWPVLADYDYSSIVGTTLSFDLDTSLSDVRGAWDLLDVFEVIIWDNSTYDDISPALRINSDGISSSSLTDVTVVPVPGAALLACIGMGMVSLIRRAKS